MSNQLSASPLIANITGKDVLAFDLAQFWSMDLGVKSHGMKFHPPGYLCSIYECFLMSGLLRYEQNLHIQSNLSIPDPE